METLETSMSRVEHHGRAEASDFRLLIMPLVVTFFAVRAATRDARTGQPHFFKGGRHETARTGGCVLDAEGRRQDLHRGRRAGHDLPADGVRRPSTRENCWWWSWRPPSCLYLASAPAGSTPHAASTASTRKPPADPQPTP